MIHGVIGGLFAKDYTLPEFPWDNEHEPKPHEYTEDEIEDLRRQGEEWAKELNKKKA